MLTIEDHADRMDASKKKKLILIGAAVVVAIILVAGISFFIIKRQNSPPDECKLQSEKPIASPTRFIRSKDNTSLVFLTSYLELKSWEKDGPTKMEYLPLILDEVELGAKNSKNHVELTIQTDCAQWVLANDAPLGGGEFTVASSKLFPKTSIVDFSDCNIRMDDIQFGPNEFYNCQQTKRCSCLSKKDREVHLVVVKFMYEIQGDPSKIEAGRFSKKERMCK